jgi:uncharacterized membrane protein YfcA
MAYGVTSTTLLLGWGLAPATASATVHLAEVGTTLLSGLAHRRFGNVDWHVVRRIGVPGAIGAFLGAVVLSSLSTAEGKPWMAGVLLALGVYVLGRFAFFDAPRRKGRPYVRRRYLAALGLTAGFVDATGGGGWGPVATPTLLATGKMEPRKVIGSVDTSEFLVASAASIGFLIGLGRSGLSLSAVAALLVGGAIAAPAAAWLVRSAAPRLLGTAAGGLIILTNVRTLVDHARLSNGSLIYGVVIVLWAGAAAAAFARHRRDQQLGIAPRGDVAQPEAALSVVG